MKIALAQFNPTVGDFSGNSARILSLAGLALQRGADLAVFSELCLCGYPPQDLLERPAFIERNTKELKELAKKVPLPALVGYAGRVKSPRGRAVANKAALLCGGKIVFEQSKMLLPTYDVFDESRYFTPAEKQVTYDFGAEHLGVTICEDVWNEEKFWPESRYDRDPVTELVVQGTTLLLNISASPYTIDKRALRWARLTCRSCRSRDPILPRGARTTLAIWQPGWALNSSLCPLGTSLTPIARPWNPRFADRPKVWPKKIFRRASAGII